jgi:hypothetical protein
MSRGRGPERVISAFERVARERGLEVAKGATDTALLSIREPGGSWALECRTAPEPGWHPEGGLCDERAPDLGIRLSEDGERDLHVLRRSA